MHKNTIHSYNSQFWKSIYKISIFSYLFFLLLSQPSCVHPRVGDNFVSELDWAGSMASKNQGQQIEVLEQQVSELLAGQSAILQGQAQLDAHLELKVLGRCSVTRYYLSWKSNKPIPLVKVRIFLSILSPMLHVVQVQMLGGLIGVEMKLVFYLLFLLIVYMNIMDTRR